MIFLLSKFFPLFRSYDFLANALMCFDKILITAELTKPRPKALFSLKSEANKQCLFLTGNSKPDFGNKQLHTHTHILLTANSIIHSR